MREEHPLQQQLPDLPTPGSDQVREMSEVAKVQAEVLPFGLVRVDKPVFVYDAKLAKQKSANAERQARFREKSAAKGLVTAQIPAEIVEKLKAVGGDWLKLTHEVVKNVEVPGPVEYVEKPMPGPVVYIDKVIEKFVPGPVQYVEKIVEKQTLKLTSEQKNCLLLGQKMQALTGFKRFLVKKIVGF